MKEDKSAGRGLDLFSLPGINDCMKLLQYSVSPDQVLEAITEATQPGPTLEQIRHVVREELDRRATLDGAEQLMQTFRRQLRGRGQCF